MSTPRSKRIDADKVRVNAYYDDNGRCHSLDIALNYDGISREDLTETIRAAFLPLGIVAPGAAVTGRHTELGATEILPAVVNARAGRHPADATTTRMTIPSLHG